MRIIAILLAAGLCGTVRPSSAQIPDSVLEARMTRRLLSCEEIGLNATTLLPRYHATGARDSVNALLDFVARRCGLSSANPVGHYALLHSMDTSGALDTAERYHNTMAWLLDFHYTFFPDNRPPNEFAWFSYSANHAHDDDDYYFLKDYGAALARREDLTPLARWTARYYASGGDTSILDELAGAAYAGTSLQRQYREHVRMERAEWRAQKFRENNFVYGAGTVGAWMPQGSLQTLGTHAVLGGEFGIMNRRWTFALPMHFHFLRSSSPYQVYFKDSLYTTNHFFGGHIGGRVDYAFWKAPNTEINIGAGIGYEGFDAIRDPYPDDNVRDGKGFGTLNLNAGVIARYYFGGGAFIAINVRYNRLSYSNPGGTDLSGNAWTAGISIGGGDGLRKLRSAGD